MQKRLPSALLACLLFTPLFVFSQPKIQLTTFATGFTRPVDIEHGGDSRLFVVEQAGLIWILDSLGNRLPDPFLNIDPRVRSTGNEQGLLGLAFPPDFAQTGFFYVDYTFEPNGDTRVSRFRVNPDNPNQADPNSEEILLTQAQPYTNHNAGCLKFGPDGYLYIAFGDGGNAGDPQNRAQNKSVLLGKILRIDVNSQSPGLAYGIPMDNPFVGDPNARPEIWSLGWRNPWRFSFDRLTGDMWVGDVGQNAHEEVDFEPAHTGGRNYGWRCYEGSFTYSASGCPPASSFIMPFFDYANPSVGRSVTGGYIYRGSKYSDLYGLYLFTDYVSGRWWATRRQSDGKTFETTQIADLADNQFCSFGEDRDGELYVAALAAGTIYRVTELCSAFQLYGTVTDANCYGSFDGIIDLDVSGGVGPYTFAWSNGQTDSLVVYLNPGTYTVQAQDAQGCVRSDTFEVSALAQIAAPGVSAVSWSAPLPDPGLICPGDSVVLEASEAPPGYGYQWYRDDQPVGTGTSRQFVVTQPGMYYVVHTGLVCNSPNSTSEVIFQTLVVAPEISVSGPAVLCSGDSTVLLVTAPLPGYTIQWLRNGDPLSGATGLELTVHTGGMYQVDMQRAGCDPDLSVPVTIGEEVAPANLTLQYLNDTLQVNTGNWSSYQWRLNGTSIPGATAPVFVPQQSGFYTCNLISPNGCSYVPGLQVEVLGTALPEVVAGFSLAPNPSSGELLLTLDLRRPERLQIFLTDARQRIILTQALEGQRIEHKLDLLNVPAGTYYLTVQLESGNIIRPVVRK